MEDTNMNNESSKTSDDDIMDEDPNSSGKGLSKSHKRRNKKNKNKQIQKEKEVPKSPVKSSAKTTPNKFDTNIFSEISELGSLRSETAAKLKQAQERKELAELNIDEIIDQLLSIRNKNPGPNAVVILEELEIAAMIEKALEVIQSQPMFLRLKAPLTIGTDIHGQYYDLLRFMNDAGLPPETNYLFLGDYVDRGKQSIETMCLLLAYKLKYPEQVFLLRGNHECENISRIYGFWDECRKRYSVKLWKQFIMLFNHFPVAALIEDKILCMHGGISPDLTKLDQINKIQRPSVIPN